MVRSVAAIPEASSDGVLTMTYLAGMVTAPHF
jgi:hypothetical protein